MAKVYEIIALIIIATVWVLIYQTYWDDLVAFLFEREPEYVAYFGDVAIKVTVADDYEERIQGLSGVTELDEFEGKLFIFDEAGQHGIWMKDMLIPLDIIWFNDDLEVIHIEENVTPDTFPDVYLPDEPARFVLEMNAYFVDALRIEEEDRLIVQPSILPPDVRERLQN